MQNALFLFLGFGLLSLLVVVCGGIVPARHQNWQTVLVGTFALPLGLLALVGVVGLFIG